MTPEHEPALALCAQDAGTSLESVRVLRREGHYKSRQLYVSTGGREPTHVVKLNDMAWRPEREYEGYRFLCRAFADARTDAGRDGPRVGAIRPVGYGALPDFLVTAYQPGRSVRPDFDAGVGLRAGAEARWIASERARSLAAWSARVRRFEPQREGGPDAVGLIDDLVRHRLEIRAHVGARAASAAAAGVALAERLLEGLSPEEHERLSWRFATHGDLAPQNFHLGPDGTLYALDLENFAFMPHHRDLCMFRARLEAYALRGPLPRRHATAIWRAYLDETHKQAPEETDALLVIAYLQRLLSHIAWMRNPEYLAGDRAAASWPNRIRQRLWMGGRLAWLRRLPGDPARAAERFRDVL
ncbi:MAG: hypothetical protein ACQGVC_20435 [Myxococcota bacterium]